MTLKVIPEKAILFFKHFTLNTDLTHKIICLMLFALSFVSGDAGAKNGTYPQHLGSASSAPNVGVLTNLTVADGLSSDIVRNIYRDSHNLLWVGTSSGLNRWDGHEMKVYTADMTGQKLHSDFVNSLQEDANDNIWLEWDSQNLVYLRQFDKFILASDYLKGLSPNVHYNILIDKDKNIWAFDKSGMLLLIDNKGKIKGKTRISRTFGDRLSWTSLPEGGILLLCNSEGVMKIGNDLKKSLLIPSINGKIRLNSDHNIYMDNSGVIWIYNYQDTNLYSFDPDSGECTSIRLPQSQDSGNCINGVIDNGNGVIWISTDHQGIYLYDKARNALTSHLDYEEGQDPHLPSNRVTDMFRDNEGNIWIGFHRDGLSVVHSSSFIRPFRDKSSGDVLALNSDNNGQIWIGTDGKGLFLKGNDGVPRKWAAVPDVAIMSMAKTHDGKIIAGSYNHGIYIIDGEKTSHFSRTKGNFPTDNAWFTNVDRNGNIWIGSVSDGLYKLTGDGNVMEIRHPDGKKLATTCIFDDNSDSLYVGSGDGYVRVNIITNSVSKPVTGNKDGSKQYLNPFITNIFKDSDDVLWLGHLGGLTAHDQKNDSIYTLTRADGLIDNAVSAITEDQRRKVWVGTNNGISAISKHRDENGSLKFTLSNYSVADGLSSNYISNNSFSKMPNNDILIGGANGYSILSPGLMNDSPEDLKVVFTSLKIGGKDVAVGEKFDELKIDEAIGSLRKLELHNTVRDVTIGFASGDILSNSRMTYAYRIKGLNDEWIVTDKHQVTVSQLPAGKYELQVKAMNSNGTWSSSVSSLVLEVKRQWFLTWWAIMLYVIVITAAITIVVTHQRRRQAEKKALHDMEVASENQRKLNEIKLQFFTNVSHDLKTPLTLILSPLQLLMKSKQDEETRSRLEIINRNATHLLSLIEHLLDFRKLDAGGEKLNLVKCDVMDALTEVCNNFVPSASLRNIEIEVSKSAPHLYAETDIVKIKKCLYNLLSNALKFSPDNSTISVEISHADDLLTVKVSDQGQGVPDEIKRDIFTRFYRATNNDSNPGSGIGLNIVSEYVKMMDGRIAVTDNQPSGASFTLVVPMEDREDVIGIMTSKQDSGSSTFLETEIQDNHENDDAAAMPLTIMVVDDNRDLCVFLADALSSEGYNVVKATSGEEAIQELEKNNVCLVVSDVMMPGIDGIELCRIIKSDVRYSHIPVILLTAKSAEEFKIKGLECGADDYLTKPFNFDILRLRIQKFLELRKERKEQFKVNNRFEPSDVAITSVDEQIIQKALKIVEDHMSDINFDVENLSAQLGMSRGHLYKKFMAILGVGPSGFIRTIRMKRGRQLLEKSQLRVSEIAYAVGYNTPKRFSISFKEEYGMTPTEYLNTLKDKENQDIIQK